MGWRRTGRAVSAGRIRSNVLRVLEKYQIHAGPVNLL
jgi:hypothetical protein